MLFKYRLCLVTIVLAIVVLTSCTPSFGQSAKGPLVAEFEVLAGIQCSKPITAAGKHDYYKVKTGPCFNLGAVHKFSQQFAVTLNLQYESKGYKYDIHQLNPDYTPPAQQRGIIALTMNYATATVTAKWYPLRKSGLYIGGGPYFAYVIRERQEAHLWINGQLILSSYSKPNSDTFKDSEFGFAGLIGYEFVLWSKVKITSRVNYSGSFTNFNKPGTADHTNSSLSLQLGIVIPRQLRARF